MRGQLQKSRHGRAPFAKVISAKSSGLAGFRQESRPSEDLKVPNSSSALPLRFTIPGIAFFASARFS